MVARRVSRCFAGGGGTCHRRGLRLGVALQASGQRGGGPTDSRGRLPEEILGGILVAKRDLRKYWILWSA